MKSPIDAASSEAPDPVRGQQDERPFVEGERGIPPVNRVRSMQSRVTAVLAIGCMSVIGVGLLGWYYSRALTRGPRAERAAQSSSQERAKGDMVLPPLGPIERPRLAVPPPVTASLVNDAPPTAVSAWLGPPPELAATINPVIPVAPMGVAPYGAAPSSTPAPMPAPRQLGGPVFTTETARQGASAGSVTTIASTAPITDPTPSPSMPPQLSTTPQPLSAAPSPNNLAERFRPTVTPAVQAQVLPTQRFLLPKGAFIDCTLETAIDSTLPGLTTCVTATDTFGVDGTTVLIERGSKLVGETQGDVRQGAARLFVLWTEVRTPTGVVVALASPGTDELGRAGLSGEVNRHFFQRFGAAMLISLVQGAVQAAEQRSNSGGTVVYSPSATADITTEVLRSTVNIPPTITKNQGDRIQVLVARDLDFRSVYDLHAANRE